MSGKTDASTISGKKNSRGRRVPDGSNASQGRSELGLTDREMDLSRSQTWLRRRIFSTFSHVKPNRWFALLEVEKYKQCIDDFLSLSKARVLFVVCLQNGQLRPHLGSSMNSLMYRKNSSADRNNRIQNRVNSINDVAKSDLPGLDFDAESLRLDVSQSVGVLLYFVKRSGTHHKNSVLTSEALSSSLLVGETITHIWPTSSHKTKFAASSNTPEPEDADNRPPGNMPLSQLSATLVDIFGRVLQNEDSVKSIYGWPNVLAEDMLQHVHEFKAKLDVVIGESGGRVVLPLPLPVKKINVETPNMLHVLEGTCMSWWKQIEAVMASGSNQNDTNTKGDGSDYISSFTPNPTSFHISSANSSSSSTTTTTTTTTTTKMFSHSSVSSEIQMWQSKARNLESIVRQLRSQKIQHVLTVLEDLGSTYVQDFQTRTLLVHDALEEAQDNARFLAPLVPVIAKMRRAIDEDYPTVVLHLRYIYRTLMNIWQISNYYNTSQRMGSMLQSLCHILVDGAVSWVDLDELLGSRSEATKKQLHEVLEIVDIMIQLFNEFSKRIHESTPEHDWSHIDDVVTFSELRKFSVRCHDVLELLQTGEQFSRLKSINVATDRGRMLTGMIHAIHEEFQTQYAKFQPGHRNYSILRPGDLRFDKHYLSFRRSLRDWDVRLAAVLEQGFDDCIMVRSQDIENDDSVGMHLGLTGQLVGGDDNPGSLSAALLLLREFGSLLRRDALSSMLQRKFPNLLRAFMSELDDVKHIFISYETSENGVFNGKKSDEMNGRMEDLSGGKVGETGDIKGEEGGSISYSKRCMNYRSLMQRIREPYIELLYHCPSNLKDGRNELVERITSRYQQLCTTIETAVKGIYQEFITWVESVIAGTNKETKMKSGVDEENSSEISNSCESHGVAEGLRRTIFCRTDVLDKIQAMAKISHMTLEEEFNKLQVDSFLDETDLPLLFHQCGLRLNNEEIVRAIDVLKDITKQKIVEVATTATSTTKLEKTTNLASKNAENDQDFNEADETSFDLEDIKQLWEKEKYPVRHAFNKYDSDGSGNIDRSEFAALLRHIGVNFTAAQFENAVTQLDPNDDGIDFDEFIDWWVNFETMSAGKLIQMNFDPRILLLLREIKYFRLMQLPIPTAGKELANFESSFRRNISHCELIVSRYNSIHVSLLPVEWPLVHDRLEALEKQLIKGLDDLTWQPALEQIQKVERHERLLKDYLSATLTQVSNLSTQLDQLKGNVFKIEQQAKRWAEKPLVERRKGDSKPLDFIASRLKLAERKTKMSEEAQILHRVVLEESQMLQIGGPPRVPRPPQRRQSQTRRGSQATGGAARRQSSILGRRSMTADSQLNVVDQQLQVQDSTTSGHASGRVGRGRSIVLVESTKMTNNVNQKRVAWESYIEYLDSIQFRGIQNAVINTMTHLLSEINIDYKAMKEAEVEETYGNIRGLGNSGRDLGSDKVNEDRLNNKMARFSNEVEFRAIDALFQIQLRLTNAPASGASATQANFLPDLDDTSPIVFSSSDADVTAMAAEFGTKSLMSQLMTVVDDIKSVADAVRHLSDPSKSFRVKLEYDEEVVKMTTLFLSTIEGVIESCRQYRNNVFLPYAFLWTENRQQFLQDFLRETNKSNSKSQLVTAEHALSNIINGSKSGNVEDKDEDENDESDPKTDFEKESDSQIMMSPPNIPEFEEMISKYTHIERLISEINSAQRFSFISVDCEPIKNSLRNATGRWTMTFTNYLEQYIEVSVSDFYRFIELVSAGIKGGELDWKTDSYDQNRLTKLMKYLFTIQQYTKHYENLVEPLQSIVSLLRKIGVAVHKVTVKKIDRMSTKWTDMLHQVYTVRDALSAVQSLEAEKIYRKEEQLMLDIENFTRKIESDVPTYVLDDHSEAYAILDRLYLDLKKLELEQEALKNAQELFGMDVFDSSSLTRHRHTLNSFKQMWDIAALIEDEASVRGIFNWAELSEERLDLINEELKRSMTMLEELPGAVARTTIYFTQHDKCTKLQQTLPLIADLHDAAMRPRHWQQLALQLKSRIDIRRVQDGTLTFVEVVGLELHQRPRIVANAIGRARKELSVERALNDMDRIWARQEFKFEFDSSIGFDLLVIDEALLQILEDKQITLQNIMAGAHFDHFTKEVEQWQSILHVVENVVIEWLATQKSWRSLRAIFLGTGSSSEDLQNRIPQQYENYRAADQSFRDLLQDVRAAPNVMATCKLEFTSVKGDGPLAKLTTMHSIFAICQQALISFLAAKQADFPRFCFISNDTLLTILSLGDDASKVQPHIAKLFDGLDGLRLKTIENEQQNQQNQQLVAREPSVQLNSTKESHNATSNKFLAVGMKGTGDEIILFDYSRRVKCDGAVEVWLSQVEKNMQAELKAQIQHALVSAADFQYKPRPAWVLEHPSQVVAVASQIQWTNDLRKAINATGYENEHVLLDFRIDQQRMLRELIMLVQSDLKPADRMKVMTMVTLDVHGRDVAKHFVEDSSLLARGLDSFAWRSQLQSTWIMQPMPVTNSESVEERKDGDGKKNTDKSENINNNKQEVLGAYVSCYDAKFEYAYEYLGNCGRLVITPLTDRCYLTLTQAMKLCLGGAPSGPAGTGKTETTKDLAHALGRAVWVFNCSDQMNHTVLGKIFKGLSLTGSWGCFDEFNRISTAVLSIVSTQFRTLTDAMRLQDVSQSRNGAYFILDGENTKMHRHKCGVFITMNPGYAGRAELPESLKTLFRTVAMMRPDLSLITENLLLSQGFINAEALATQIVTMIDMSKNLLSIQVHYDWTLRTVKTIINIAGNLRRDKPKKPENHIIYISINTLMAPKLVESTGDRNLFRSILRTLYPEFAFKLQDTHQSSSSSSSSSSESDCDDVDKNLLENGVADSYSRDLIIQSAQASGLEASPSFVQRVLDISALCKVRHSLFILGAEATGKTELWHTLAHLNTRIGLETTYQQISPKTLYLEELFGRINTKTKEWQDGVFTGIMKSQAASPGNNQKWIVLDGDVDPEWVESLNTVMDDNKVLTLSNNERINLNSNMRIIIEAIDLKFATPATISRAGVLYVNDTNSTWEAFIANWARKRFAKHGKRMNSIIHLIRAYLRACTSQMNSEGCLHEKYQIVPVCAFGLVRSTINLFDSLLQSHETLFTARKLRENYSGDDGTSHKLELLFSFAVIWSFGAVIKHEQRWRFSSWIRNFWTQEHGSRQITFLQIAHGPKNTTTVIKSMYPDGDTVFDWLPVLVGSDEHTYLSSILNGGQQTGEHKSQHGGQSAQIQFYSWSALVPHNEALPINLPLKMQHDGTMEGVEKASRLPPPSLLQLLIPCATSQCNMYFLKKRALVKENILCAGPTGCGKTVLMRSFLDWLGSENQSDTSSHGSATISRTISLTYATTTQSLQDIMDESLEKKAGKTYAPPGRQNCVFFIDDMNLPEVDQYGTQRALALIQHHLDTGAMYDRVKLIKKYVTGIRYVACLDPSAGQGIPYRPNTARLIRHFSVHSLNQPSDEQMTAIFTQVLSSHLLECYFYGTSFTMHGDGNDNTNARSSGSYAMFESGAHGVGLRLVQATISLHNQVRRRFSASANHFYYGFSMKHIAATVQGLLQVTPKVSASPRLLARLWLHETSRVYSDCLSNQQHRNDFLRIQRDALRQEICTTDMGSGRSGNHNISSNNTIEGDQLLAAWSASDTAEAQQAFQRPEVVFGRFGGVSISSYGEFPGGINGAIEELNNIQQQNVTNEGSQNNLVLFHEAVMDIIKICRILQTTGGHGLLVGVGGSGKRSLTRLASNLAHVHLREIRNDNPNNTTEFSETLKSMCRDAGVKGLVVAVMITEHLLASSYVMHVINAMMSGAGMGGLFSKNEKEEMAHAVKAAVRRSGEMDTSNNCWSHFTSEVMRNIHIICTVSPSSKIFRRQFTRYPALIRCTTRIHVLPWNSDALNSVAESFVSSLDIEDLLLPVMKWENSVLEEVLEEYKRGLIANNEDATLETHMRRLVKQHRMTQDVPSHQCEVGEYHKKIMDFLVGAHTNATQLAETLRREHTSYVHVIPALFLRVITGFTKLLHKTKQNIEKTFSRLALGRFKLIVTSERVEKMQATLTGASAEVAAAMETAERQREKLGEESHKVDQEAKVAAIEEEECERIRIDIQALKSEAQADLDRALPILEKAQCALESLDKPSLIELKSFKAPHHDVHTVMMAVLTLLSGISGSGVKLRPNEIKKGHQFLETGGDPNAGPLGWYAAQRSMRDVTSFLNLLRSYADVIDQGLANADAIHAVDIYLALPSFEKSTIERRSRAAAGICEWVINIRKYYEVWCEVDPKRKRLAAEAKRLAKSEAKLVSAKNHFRKVHEQLSLLTDAFTNATSKKNDALRRYQQLSQKLELAERLRSVLASEKERWEAEIKALSKKSGSFIGDALMTITFATYSGGFDSLSRDAFIYEQCIEAAQSIGLKISEETKINMATVAITDRERADWSSLGDLPEDHTSQDNATLVALAYQTPLIIDPHQQATNFIAKLYRRTNTNLRVATLIGADDSTSDWRSVLKSAVVQGDTVLLENIGAEMNPDIVRVLEACSHSQTRLPRQKQGRRVPTLGKDNTTEGVKFRQQIHQSANGRNIKLPKNHHGNHHSLSVSFDGVEVRVHCNFKLFLTTREARPRFSPDLQILTTLVDFTVSEMALSEQLLGVTVALQCPELEKRKQSIRLSLAKLQNELKELEDDLLLALSSSQGDVLSNKTLVESLEHTKTTARDVSVQVEEAHFAAEEADAARRVYVPIAERGVLMFSIWEALRQVDPLYQLSLESFMRVYILSIQNAEDFSKKGELGRRLGKTITSGFDPNDPQMQTNKHEIKVSEVAILLESVTLSCFRGAARVLFERHKAGYLFVLALRLLMVYIPQVLPNDVVDLLLGEWLNDVSGSGHRGGEDQHSPLEWLPTTEWLAILQLSQIEDFVVDFGDSVMSLGHHSNASGVGPNCSFKAIPQHIMSHPARWEQWFQSSHPELEYLPGEWRSCSIIHHLCLVRVLRPDRLRPMIYRLVDDPTLSLGIDFRYIEALSANFSVESLLRDATLPAAGVQNTRQSITLQGVRIAPMIFIVSPGTDPTSQIQKEARKTGNDLQIMALGQGQFEAASSLIRNAWSKGGWVLIQNIHLVPDDLKKLTGLIEILNTSPIPRSRPPRVKFCLFMTAEPIFATLIPAPVELIRTSLTTTLEPPTSFDAHLHRALGTFEQKEWLLCDSQPMAYQRTLFSLCYWHAVALSRRDLGTVGWSTHYPFGDAELKISAEVLLGVLMRSGSSIDIVGLRHLVGQIVYGGHIVDPFDRRLCMAYMNRLFHEKMMVNEGDCFLAHPEESNNFSGLLVPQVDVVENYYQNINDIDIPYKKFGPVLLGMHPDAQLGSRSVEASNIVMTINRLLGSGGVTGSSGTGTASVDLEHTVAMIDSLLDDLPHVGGQSNDDSVSGLFGDSKVSGAILDSGAGNSAGEALTGESASQPTSGGAYSFLYTREHRILVDGITRVRGELRSAELFCRGETISSEETNQVVESIATGEIPRRWILFTSPDVTLVSFFPMNLTSWIRKVKRTHEFQSLWAEAVMRQSNGTPPLMDLSCILNPRALLSAICLDGARLMGKSLDNITLAAKLTARQPQGVTRSPENGGLFLSGLKLEGALWDLSSNPPLLKPANSRQLASSLPVVHAYSKLLEEQKANKEREADETNKIEDEGTNGSTDADVVSNTFICPVYANKQRGNSYLLDIPFPIQSIDHRLEKWTIQGIAIILENGEL
jgi:dynein heavy chain, axonemal